MQKGTNIDAFDSSGATPAKPDGSAADCIDFAQECCSRANRAARLGRMQAAHGLVQTAVSLFERAAKEDGRGGALEERLDRLVEQLCLCAQSIEIEAVAGTTMQQGRAA